ncbi:peptidase, partial [Fischerella thermalis CCMEE 5318]
MTTVDRAQKLVSAAVSNLPVNRLATKMVAGILATLPVALALPAEALQVRMTPTNPKLGDTLSVFISVDNPVAGASPTVT